MLAVFAAALVILACAPEPTLSPSASVVASQAATPSPSPTPTIAPTATPDPAASPGASPGAQPSPGASTEPCPLATPLPTIPPGQPNAGQPLPHALCPAVPSGNPVDLLAWLFNPIFQTLFLALTAFDYITGDIGIAIILLTVVIKTVLLPLSRRQIVSQRKMQLIQPEVRAIQQKYKGNRAKISEETMRLYRERNVSLGAGCLPAFLQLGLLIPIYSVISTGLAATDISSALQFLSIPVLQDFVCQAPGTLEPCINTIIPWLGNLDAHLPQVTFRLPVIDFPVSVLAVIAAALQVVQTRMMAQKTTDPQAQAQQRIFLILPIFSIIYGAILPAGLFIYWIVFTIYSIVQQYLITGWGGLFPLFGWTPGFAQDHKPRFPVKFDETPVKASTGAESGPTRRSEPDSRTATDRAAGTIKPAARSRARTSRRGRRR
jgi:YidC/Oxa1 family membrane protein insertase